MILNAIIKTFCPNVWKYISRNMSEEKLPPAEKNVSSLSSTELTRKIVKVSTWNKRLLVFAGRFKTMAEIPDKLPIEVLLKSRDKVRVKVANIMIVLTIIGCFVMIRQGKKAAEAGESVAKMNRDWHSEYNERAKREEEAERSRDGH